MAKKPSYLKSLIDEQEQAVLTTEGRICGVAGEGSGKTRTLVHLYAILWERSASLSRISSACPSPTRSHRK